MKDLLISFVAWRYIINGLLWGCHESFPDAGPNPHTVALRKWERRHAKLGFKPVDQKFWIRAVEMDEDVFADRLFEVEYCIAV